MRFDPLNELRFIRLRRYHTEAVIVHNGPHAGSIGALKPEMRVERMVREGCCRNMSQRGRPG
jgi:hypothetical protein